MLSSCNNDDEKFMTFINDDIPDATDNKSTSVIIPFYGYENANVQYSLNKDFSIYQESMVSVLPNNDRGYYLQGLEPDTTYYYRMSIYKNKSYIYSNQVKSFTTKGVSIEFIEPDTVSMGYWTRSVLRVKTTGIEDIDIPYHILVRIYGWPSSNPSEVGWFPETKYVGDGIWTNKSIDSRTDGYCYQAFVETYSGRKLAKTSVITSKNRTWLLLSAMTACCVPNKLTQ